MNDGPLFQWDASQNVLVCCMPDGKPFGGIPFQALKVFDPKATPDDFRKALPRFERGGRIVMPGGNGVHPSQRAAVDGMLRKR